MKGLGRRQDRAEGKVKLMQACQSVGQHSGIVCGFAHMSCPMSGCVYKLYFAQWPDVGVGSPVKCMTLDEVVLCS